MPFTLREHLLFLKNVVYSNPHTLEELLVNIQHTIYGTSIETLKQVFPNRICPVLLCESLNGQEFQFFFQCT